MQRDLFKDFRAEESETIEPVAVSETQPSFFERIRIVLTLDKMILWGLLNIIAMVFIYSAGIEHGMKASKRAVSPEAEAVAAKVPESVKAPSGLDPESFPAEPAASVLPAAQSTEKKSESTDAAEFKSDHFTIQLVTYKRKDQAENEVVRLTQKGHKAFIIPSGKFFQVCVEKFEKKPDAFQKLIELKLDGFGRLYQGAYVRPVKNS